MKYFKYLFLALLLILISCSNSKKEFQKHNRLAQKYATSDSLEQAIKEWQRAIKADPENELAPKVMDNISNAKRSLQQQNKIKKLNKESNKLGQSANATACMQNMAAIESAANIGYAKNALAGEAKYPTSIDVMMTKGWLLEMPVCPAGGKYIYDSNNGTVKCTVHGK